MGRPRSRLNWHYDDARQQFTTPSGRVISLQEIARLLANQADCRFDFTGPWTGWRMRGDALIPPGTPRSGPRLKPDTGKHLARWIADANHAASASGIAPNRPPGEGRRLKLVYSSTR